MNLGEYKKMLAKFPPDMDDLHVMLVTVINGERQIDLVTGMGHIPLPNGGMAVAVVGYEEIKRQVEATGLKINEPPAEG